MKKTYFFILLLVSILQNIQSQEYKLSKQSEISIITVGPGDILYEAFGHSAIRYLIMGYLILINPISTQIL